MKVLAINAGSSSLKFRLIEIDREEKELASGSVERIGTPEAKLSWKAAGREPSEQSVHGETPAEAVELAIRRVREMGIDAVGHRIVDGGPKHVAPVRITPEILSDLRSAQLLDPLHVKAGVDGIEAATRLLPSVPQVAAFDTTFHQTMPEIAWRYAIPRDLADRNHLRRYGFHGLSYQYVAGRLLKRLDRPAEGTRLILCHLGSGASACAVKDGKSVDTSMGLTPLEGLVMGTRSGDIDPGLLIYLINVVGLNSHQVRDLLNKKSGLLGLAGSGDVRDLIKSAGDGDKASTLALDIFAYRASKYIGAYAAALGGLDALAFTGGIGERSALIRGSICQGLDFLGLRLDEHANDAAKGDSEAQISSDVVSVWVILTNEELQVAREVCAIVASE